MYLCVDVGGGSTSGNQARGKRPARRFTCASGFSSPSESYGHHVGRHMNHKHLEDHSITCGARDIKSSNGT